MRHHSPPTLQILRVRLVLPVRLHVPLTQDGRPEVFGTQRALEGPRRAVYEHVSGEGAVCGEAGRAGVTPVLLGSHVCL